MSNIEEEREILIWRVFDFYWMNIFNFKRVGFDGLNGERGMDRREDRFTYSIV